MIYRWRTGAIAWLFQRISGIALSVYLVMHIWIIHSLSEGPRSFNKIMETMNMPIFKLAEIALLGAVVFHALNGIRVLVIDFGNGAKYQKKLFWGAVGIGVVLFLAGAYPLFIHAADKLLGSLR